TLNLILENILNEIKLPFAVVGGMPTYRNCLSISFFTRFWYQVIKELRLKNLEENILLNIDEIERGVSFGFQDIGSIENKEHALGTLNPHLSALKQTTGVARYVDDIPKQQGELCGVLVLSTKAHAYIKKVDASKALQIEGVCDFITHQDFKFNYFGPIVKDEEILASNEVYYAGQPIGMIVAESR
ncbi:unnamed protein product, partial [Brachionus calyciflorus]